MNWTHSSKIIVLAVLLATSLTVGGTTAAVDVSGDNPESAQVGETVEYQIEVTDLYTDQGDQWTLEGETGLDNASWQIVAYDVAGEEVDRTSSNQFELDRSSSGPDVDRLVITVQGQVPEIENYDYQNREEEEIVGIGISAAGGSILDERRVHRYTEDSREARNRIDEASEHVSEDNDDFQSAVDLYDSGNFDQAMTEADNIINDAESSEQTQTLLFVGAGVVVLLVLAGGGFYLYQQRSQDTNKLQ